VRADKPSEPPRTTAEKSDYKATSRHADVVAFCEELARQSKSVRVETFGHSRQGRTLPVLILADPPVTTSGQVGKRMVVLITANIHAGEVDGKEAVLMLARDLSTTKQRELLKDLVILIVPNLNPDGNEKMGKHRPDQNGPEEVGTRENAQGLDLNRDFIKLESPEVQSLMRLVNTWNPAVILDMHTTDGSYHRYAVTYDGPRHPAGNQRIVNAVRDVVLPDIGKRLLKRDSLHSFFYGNFSKDRKQWLTYPALPRYGIVNHGLRNRIGLLCESYSHAPFKERVQASRAFALACLEHVAENRDRLRVLLNEAREATVRGGKKPRGDDQIALRFRTSPRKEPVTIRGVVEEMKEGKRVPTEKPQDYKVDFLDQCEATLSVPRPFAYLYPPALTNVTENLQRHGIEVEELREDIELDIEAYRIEKLVRAAIPYQKHNLVSVEAVARKETRRIPAGTILVRTAQPLATLAAFLLEPMADDGLCTWNFFDADLTEGMTFPVQRLPAPAFLTSGKVRPLPPSPLGGRGVGGEGEGPQAKKKPITLEDLMGNRLPSFNGNPVAGLTWLDDGEHFLQVKDRQLLKVHAVSGRATPFVDHEKLARCLAGIPDMKRMDANALARSPALNMNKQRTAIVVEHKDDLWYCPFDAEKAIRLTNKPGKKELAAFSPDGKHVAFVRGGNLYVVDIATKSEKPLTSDGSEVISNGKADWVYFEEINNRNWNAFWWSPDSKHIAFLRLDDTKLKKFTVLDQIPLHQTVEQTPYPMAGDPNPEVKLGIVPIEGGPIRWAPLGDYTETPILVSRVGWDKEGKHCYFYVQNRTQTWLHSYLMPPRSQARMLFEQKTKAWVDDPGPATFLKDGSFLLPSEHTGWKHLYHYSADGKTVKAVTSGEWEIRTVHQVDEENGLVYFSAMRDSPVAQNLYRVKLDGSELTRLTRSSGDHLVQVAPKGGAFIDTWSDIEHPIKVQLCKNDGSRARMLDTNPVHAVDDYEFLSWEKVQVKMQDGFLLEGMILTPPRKDPSRRFPVWVKTYGGPHTPTVKESWLAGRSNDQALARAGFIIFQVDPRSASGKGAYATWTAYKQLGVQELQDLETAVQWICQRPYVDAKRIGLSGHSYGGFMTSYALTHSKLFAAGIAGAPVTDWHLYDSIYTERYMLTPKENPQGYAKTSVVKAAKDLHGKLLILHGNMDDNVHVQNTMRLVDELQKANKDFELMIYPRSRHPILGQHYRRLVVEFMQRTLKPEP
jgi:dipeptidyl aminopeptidase/acylaminoacyl peptidase